MYAISPKDGGVSVAPRVSLTTILAVSALSIFTAFITWRARVVEIALEQPLNVRVSAPDFRAITADGKSVSLADFRGKKVVLAFWASWCGPCQEEMGALNTFYRAHHTASSDFEILAISIDEDTAQAAHFATEKKLTFPVLLDPHETVARAYEENGVPTLFVIDQYGNIRYAHVGFDRSDSFERVLAGELGINFDQPLNGGSSGARD
ncbi:MAG: peroxiredoxin family protein [Candidatus Sulfotelmatobacter sp.]